MIANNKMIDILKENHFLIKNVSLPSKLIKILNKGFVSYNDCYFIKFFFNHSNNITNDFFKDKVSYECFVNSFHLDDYVDKDYLNYSILFCNHLLMEWYRFSNLPSKVIISLDDEDLSPTLKFHIHRKSEFDFIRENELNNYIQPILISSNIIENYSIRELLLNNKF